MHLFDLIIIIALSLSSKFCSSPFPLVWLAFYSVSRMIAIYFEDKTTALKKRYRENVISFFKSEINRLENEGQNTEHIKTALEKYMTEKPKDYFIFRRFI